MNNISFKNDIMPLKERLFRLALRIVQNREEAEDIVQDTLMKLWNQREQWGSIDNIETYSLTICRNLALDAIEKKERHNISLDDSLHDRPDTTWQPDETLTHKQQMGLIEQVVDRLPEKQRTILQLRDIEGMSYQEIAETMMLSLSDVKVNLFRAREKLKQTLSPMNQTNGL